MACRNLCERLDSKTIVGKSIYEAGKKYCRRCEVYFLDDGLFCPCCGMRSRVSPGYLPYELIGAIYVSRTSAGRPLPNMTSN